MPADSVVPSTVAPDNHRVRRTTRWTGDAWKVFVGVAMAYSAGAVLAWLSFGAMSGPAFFFPAAGVTLAAMLLTRPSVWPAVVAAVVVGEMGVDVAFGAPTSVAAGYTVANVIEPLIAATVIRAICGGAPDLTTRRELAVFVGGGCLLGPIAGGLIGGSVAAHHEGLAWLPTVATWWAGDALGALVVGAPILLWPRQSWVFVRHRTESVAALALTAGLGIVAFRSELPPSLIMLPLLVWAALRLNVIGAALTGTVMGFLANSMYTRSDFFAGVDLPDSARLLIARVLLGVMVVVAMLIAQESAGRTAAQQLHTAERRERRRLQSLAGLAQQLSAALTRDDIGEAIAANVLDDAGASAVNLGVVSADRTHLEWVCIVGYAAPITARYKQGIALTDRTAATDTLASGTPQRFPSPQDFLRRYPAGRPWLEMSGLQSLLHWPVTDGKDTIGVLTLGWQEPQPLDSAQQAYTAAVATLAGQALRREQVYADERDKAVALQTAILPTSPVSTREMGIGVYYQPAETTHGVGGDWFDTLVLPKGQIYLCVGDVVGHGLPAVQDMAQLRSAARTLALLGTPPERIMAEMNYIAHHSTRGGFATMAVALYDPDTRKLAYSTAGHPPPLLLRNDPHTVELLDDGHGPVLGPVRTAGYAEGTTTLNPGDLLALYTDGLIERPGLDIDAGIQRLADTLTARRAAEDLSGACHDICTELTTRPHGDDTCILLARISAP